MKKNILVLIIIVVIISILGGVIIWKYSEISKEDNSSGEIIQEKESNIESVKKSFEMIKKAHMEKDRELYEQYITNQSKTIFADWELIEYKDMEFIKALEDNDKIIVTIKVTHSNNRTEEQSIFFIKEDGIWKMDLIGTLEQNIKEYEEEKAEEPTNELPDYIVVDIKAFPEPPMVNDQETELEVLIKNIGKGSSAELLELSWQIDNGTPGYNSLYGIIIEPDQTESIIIRPYLINIHEDSAGEKTILIQIDPDNIIQESDEENNIFSKKINFIE